MSFPTNYEGIAGKEANGRYYSNIAEIADPKEPAFKRILQLLRDKNEVQEKYISEIHAKLVNVIGRGSGEIATDNPLPEPIGLPECFEHEIDRMESTISRMRKVMEQLNSLF